MLIYGNDWDAYRAAGQAIYLQRFTHALNTAEIAVNIHREPGIGLNRRFFEFIPCAFTLVDRVPGVEEILGKELTDAVTFSTPAEAREKVHFYLANYGLTPELHARQVSAIQNYTYQDLARQVVE